MLSRCPCPAHRIGASSSLGLLLRRFSQSLADRQTFGSLWPLFAGPDSRMGFARCTGTCSGSSIKKTVAEFSNFESARFSRGITFESVFDLGPYNVHHCGPKVIKLSWLYFLDSLIGSVPLPCENDWVERMFLQQCLSVYEESTHSCETLNNRWNWLTAPAHLSKCLTVLCGCSSLERECTKSQHCYHLHFVSELRTLDSLFERNICLSSI